MEAEDFEKLDPADEVMSVRLYKRDPFCMEYAFLVTSNDEADTPLHLEQLKVIQDLVQKHIEMSERAVLSNSLASARRLRRAQKDQMERMETVKGEPN